MRVWPIAAALVILAAPSLAQEPLLPPGAPPNFPVKRGFFAVTIGVAPGLPSHTVSRPSDRSSLNGMLPIVAWGNGGCSNASNGFEAFLTTAPA